MSRYRILQGRHFDMPKDTNGPIKMYNQGEVIDTTDDLLALNSPGSPKFELIDGGAPASPLTWNPQSESLDQFVARMRTIGAEKPTPTTEPQEGLLTRDKLERMTMEEIQALVDEAEIDTAGVTSKAGLIEIIVAIQATRAA